MGIKGYAGVYNGYDGYIALDNKDTFNPDNPNILYQTDPFVNKKENQESMGFSGGFEIHQKQRNRLSAYAAPIAGKGEPIPPTECIASRGYCQQKFPMAMTCRTRRKTVLLY